MDSPLPPSLSTSFSKDLERPSPFIPNSHSDRRMRQRVAAGFHSLTRKRTCQSVLGAYQRINLLWRQILFFLSFIAMPDFLLDWYLDSNHCGSGLVITYVFPSVGCPSQVQLHLISLQTDLDVLSSVVWPDEFFTLWSSFRGGGGVLDANRCPLKMFPSTGSTIILLQLFTVLLPQLSHRARETSQQIPDMSLTLVSTC